MAIELDGSKFGTSNGTADLIEMCRDMYQRGRFFSLPKHSEQSYSRDSSDHPTLPAVVFIGACSVGFVGCGEWLVHQLVAGVYAQTRLLMTSKAQSQNCNEKLTQVTVK